MSQEQGKVKPPNLNSSRYVRLAGVPIIDAYSRTRYRIDDKGNKIPYKDEITPEQLETICRNSIERSKIGEYGLVRVGHTSDDGPETSQPPVVGFLDGYRIGSHNSRPTILSDVYIDTNNSVDKDVDALLNQYLRRSVELAGQNSPEGFIDSVALINRLPARNLGLVTARFRDKLEITRFSCPDPEDEMAKETTVRDEMVDEIVEQVFTRLTSPEGIARFADAVKDDESAKKMVDKKIKKKKKTACDKDHDGVEDHQEMEKSRYSDSEQDDDDLEDDEEDDDEEESEDQTDSSKVKETSKPAESKKVKRMREDSANIRITRFEAQIQQLADENKALKDRLDSSEKVSRESMIESRITQLEAEGYILDRPDEVSRFMELADDAAVDREIKRIRQSYRKSPVNQPFIPGLGHDMGGNGVHDSAPKISESYPTDILRFAETPDIKEQLRKIKGPEAKMEYTRQQFAEVQRKAALSKSSV